MKHGKAYMLYPSRFAKCVGSKVMIDPEKLAAFQHAPVVLNDELRNLESTHKKSYEEMLAFMAESKVGEEGTDADDPRPEDPEEVPKDGNWIKFDSLKGLEDHAQDITSRPVIAESHRGCL